MVHLNKESQFEIGAVLVTGVSKFLLADWLDLRAIYLFSAVLFWIIYILNKYRRDKHTLKKWGFQRENFRKSFLVILPFALITISGIILYGIQVDSFSPNRYLLVIILIYPIWGIIQQFMMLGLIAGNLRTLVPEKFTSRQVTIIVCSFFSLVHYPDIRLMIYAGVMELILINVFFRWKNLWAAGLYHGWVSSLFIFVVLRRDLWSELWHVFR